jgi:hypothetical protein
MNEVEFFANTELADAGTQGEMHIATAPVMTAAAFMAGIVVACATVQAYEAGAGNVQM